MILPITGKKYSQKYDKVIKTIQCSQGENKIVID